MSGIKLPGLSKIEEDLRRREEKEESRQHKSEVVYIDVYWNTWYFRKRFITLFFTILGMLIATIGYDSGASSFSINGLFIFFTFVASIVLIDQIIIGYTFFKGDIRSAEVNGR